MDDPRWLRLITIGLVLAALAVGYFLLAGGFSVGKSKIAQTSGTQQINKLQQSPLPKPNTIPLPATASASDHQNASSAYTRIVNRTQATTQTLPKTGFPIGLAVIFSASAVVSGLGLRKFPN